MILMVDKAKEIGNKIESIFKQQDMLINYVNNEIYKLIKKGNYQIDENFDYVLVFKRDKNKILGVLGIQPTENEEAIKKLRFLKYDKNLDLYVPNLKNSVGKYLYEVFNSVYWDGGEILDSLIESKEDIQFIVYEDEHYYYIILNNLQVIMGDVKLKELDGVKEIIYSEFLKGFKNKIMRYLYV